MTPEEARYLLAGTTPGPWLSDLDRNSDEPIGIYAVVAQGGGFSARLVAEEIGEEADTALIASAPALASMIAGMREEWGVAYRRDDENKKRTTWGWDTREDAERSMRLMTRVYVYGPVRRYVTEPEEA